MATLHTLIKGEHWANIVRESGLPLGLAEEALDIIYTETDDTTAENEISTTPAATVGKWMRESFDDAMRGG